MVTTPYFHSQDYQRDVAFWSAFRMLESVVYLIVLLFFSGGVIGLFFADPAAAEAQSALARTLWYPVYALVILVSLMTLPRFLKMAAFSPIIIFCVLACGATYFWSVDPSITLRRSIALMVTTMAGLALAARYDWSEMVQRIAFVFLIAAIISLFIIITNPARGIMSEIHVGAWRGVWVEKNYLGGNMTKGLIACMCAFAMRPSRAWLWIPGGLLCFFLVLMSTSKTALLISVSAILLFFALRLFRRFPIIRIPLLYSIVASLTVFFILVLAIPEEMFAIIGKDPTLTGRTDIWDLLMMSIKQKFWLGYGYGTYWADPLGPSYSVRTILQWGVPSAHNGWIETWLSGGVVVVAMFAFHFIVVTGFAVDRIGRGGVEAYWVVLSTLMFLGFSMSESTILQQNDLSWVLFVATSAKLFAFDKPYWRKSTIRRKTLEMQAQYR
ncbi:O-antigen ligase family protein [Litorimonas sp. RW-G-Af-16]|uniref:O-antigen ligase family protein n=1 Tax=Litorimonas sp. RW-G-Af-16 TaxID=3241168 RepID=UPI00390C5DB2